MSFQSSRAFGRACAACARARLTVSAPLRAAAHVKWFRRAPVSYVTAALIGLLVVVAMPAHQWVQAQAPSLRDVGPLNANTGFPVWYQDSTGLRLQACLDAGNCLSTLPDPTKPASVGTTPETTNYPDEVFYWSADSAIDTPAGVSGLLTLAQEQAFATDVVAGDQMVFGRVRIRVTGLVNGATYRITHPFGTNTFTNVAGGTRGINFTEDIGCFPGPGTPCDFRQALASRIDPFLVWDTFGLPENQGGPPAGYVGDPNIEHRVTGSAFGTNFFRIERIDAAGNPIELAGESDLFTVEGKIAGLSVIASPQGSTYKDSLNVRLMATDLAADVYYTIDGTDPADPANPSRTKYARAPDFEVPIAVPNTADLTMKFVAEIPAPPPVDPTLPPAPPVQSAVFTELYKFDTVVPVLTVTPPGGSFNKNPSVAMAMNEPGTIFYTTNESDPGDANNLLRKAYAGPLQITTGTVVKAVAQDTVGNQSAVQVHEYIIDTVPPVAPSVPALEPESDTGSSSTDGITNALSPFFTGTSEPGATLNLLVRRSGTSTTVVNGTTTVEDTGFYIVQPATPLTAGTYFISAQAVDKAGNKGTGSATMTLTIDTTPPTVTLGTKPANPSSSANPSFSFTASEGGATASCALTLSGNADDFQPCTSPKSYAGVADGTYTFKARAFDVAGNEGVASYTFAIDTAVPTVTASVPGGTYAAAQTVALSSTKPGSIYFTTNGATPTPATGTLYSAPLTISVNTTLKYIAVDTLGNQSLVGTSIYVIDNVAPIIAVNPAPGLFNAPQSVSLTATNETSPVVIRYTTDGTAPTSASTIYTAPIPVSGPTTTIQYFASDAVGNTSAVAIATYTIDAVPPTVSASPAGGLSKTGPSVTLSSEAGAAIRFTLNGAAPTATTGTVYSGPIVMPNNAVTTLRFIAIDAAKNVSAVGTETYTVDNQAPTATASPTGRAFNAPLSVTLTTEAGSSLFYTTTGIDPTTSDTQYTAPIALPTSGTTTLKFIAVDPAGNASAVGTETYTFDNVAPVVSASPAGGSYSAPQSVQLTAAGEPASTAIYYTTNGTTPTTSSTRYTAPVTIASASATTPVALKFIAVDAAANTSAVRTETYTIDSVLPVITASPAGRTANTATSVTLTSNKTGGTIYYTLDGSAPTTASTQYSAAIAMPLDARTTLRFFGVDALGNASLPATETYVVDTQAPGVSANPLGGTFAAAQNVTLSATDNNPGAVTPAAQIFYTTNGTAPTTASTPFTGTAINIAATTTLRYLALDAAGNQATGQQVYTINNDTTAPAVTASPLGGTFATAQSVALSANETATIFFTTNGTAPTTASAQYTGPIAIATTTTLRYIARDTAGNVSAAAQQIYTIDSVAPTVAASPLGGSFTTAQSVTLTASDNNPGSSIFFTTNGTAPTTGSTPYTGPIAVTATTTVNFIAVDAAGNQSAVGTQTYTITTPPVGGALPTGWQTQDIGAVGVTGSASFTSPTFTVAGGGADIWGAADAFRFAYTPLTGDGQITARVATEQAVNVWTKSGVMIRESVAAGSRHGLMLVSPGKGNAFQRRLATNGVSTNTAGALVTASYWVRIARAGNTITASQSANGTTWTVVGTDTIAMGPTVLVGLVVSSHSTTATAAATFDNVLVEGPSDTTAPVVTASPAGGTFTTAQSVTLTANEPATIFFTVDGSAPTTASAQYAGPIAIAATTTLRYVGRDTAGNVSAAAQQVYTINITTPDTTPPTVAASPLGGSFTSAQSVTLTATDNNPGSAIFFTTNGTTPTSASTRYTSPIAVATTTTLKFLAIDAAGNASAVGTQTYTITTPPTGGALPAGWLTQDIGAVGLAGSASFASPTFTVTGAGADIWGTADALRYAYTTLNGDGQITARVATEQAVNVWTKAGVMIRDSAAAGSREAVMLVSPGKGNAFQRRLTTNGVTTSTTGALVTAPYWVRIARVGNTITASQSANGTTWTVVGTDTIAFGPTVQIGLAVSSHSTTATAAATFDNVLIESLWANQDIGAVGLAGSTSISNGVFTVTGAGADIWGAADAFHFTYQRLTGDGQITARVNTVSATNVWHKVGVMLRNDLTPGSAHATMFVSSAKGLAFQRRVTAGGVSTSTAGPLLAAPRWVRIARAGSLVTASYSNDGTTWTVVGTETMTMGTTIYVGLANSSHTTTALGTATVDSVVR